MSGFELEALDTAAPAFTGVVVAEIVEAVKHPQAEKLQVCKVRAGGGELLQIVCGAANARAGLKTALATVGAKLPGDKAITAAKLRGVDSVRHVVLGEGAGPGGCLRRHRRAAGRCARGHRTCAPTCSSTTRSSSST